MHLVKYYCELDEASIVRKQMFELTRNSKFEALMVG